MRMSWEGERRGKGGRRRVRNFFLRVGENCVSLKKRIFFQRLELCVFKKKDFFSSGSETGSAKNWKIFSEKFPLEK